MSARVALDTNILAHAEGVNGAERRTQTLALLGTLAPEQLVIPAQVLAELFFVLTRKAKRPVADARRAVSLWADASAVQDTTPEVLAEAMELVVSHQLSWWDAVVLAAGTQGGARYLWSEDLQDGFVWRGVTVANLIALGKAEAASSWGIK